VFSVGEHHCGNPSSSVLEFLNDWQVRNKIYVLVKVVWAFGVNVRHGLLRSS
jgi:hypothetical protein